MRILLLGCLLTVPVFGHSADPAACKSRDLASEHSWNPPSAAVTPRLRHFYGLADQLEAAQENSDTERMERLANEYLVAAEEYRCNWNYGNAVHDANSALGLAAFAKDDKALAAKYLLEAAKSPGSPQLDTFGPTMVLADRLVGAGSRDAVIGYLQGVRRFWRMDNGELEEWIEQLEAGKTPDFRMQLH